MATVLSPKEKGLDKSELRVRRKRILKELGFKMCDYRDWRAKWRGFVQFALQRSDNVHIHFPLYMVKVKEAGIKKPYEIGKRRGQYQLGRIGDCGGYTKSSCRFITMEQNQAERKLNGGTAVAVEKAARVRRGQTKESDEHIASMAEKLSGRTAQTHSYLAAAGRKRGRAFEVFSPEGKRYTGQSLNAFCKAKGLNQANMSLLCRGLRLEFKGWKGSYTEELKPWYKTKESRAKEKKCKTSKVAT